MGKFSGVLLASDLDGTLLNSEHLIDPENVGAIRYFVENGGIFTLATGRPISAAKRFFPQLVINAPVILYNGGVVYDSRADEILSMRKLDDGYLDAARDIMMRFPDAGVEFHMLDTILLSQPSDISKHHFEIVNQPFVLTPIEEVKPPIIKGLITQSEERLADILQYFLEKYGEKYAVTSSAPYFLEITDKKANKGIALLELAESLGVDAKCLCAVGDSLNDLEMIKGVSISFAPENALDEVKKHAGRLVSDNDHFALSEVVALLDKKY